MHIGFILDWNRTWARARWLPTFEWHRQWYKRIEPILDLCYEQGMEYVSLWVLSNKNITERSKEEVKYLFELLEYGIVDLGKKAIKKWYRIELVGDLELIPEKHRKPMIESVEKTKEGTSMTVLIAIGYGWQNEIVRATKRAIESGISASDITEETFLSFLDTGAFPPPDLIVRTGWHTRHSGFFLFQSEYSEYYFPSINWPDFSEEELYKALNSYSKAERKFWK